MTTNLPISFLDKGLLTYSVLFSLVLILGLFFTPFTPAIFTVVALFLPVMLTLLGEAYLVIRYRGIAPSSKPTPPRTRFNIIRGKHHPLFILSLALYAFAALTLTLKNIWIKQTAFISPLPQSQSLTSADQHR